MELANENGTYFNKKCYIILFKCCGKTKSMPGGNCTGKAKLHVGIEQRKGLDMEKRILKIVLVLGCAYL